MMHWAAATPTSGWRIDGEVRTVVIRIPSTNTYLADGVWTHNDAPSSSRGGLGISDNTGGGTGPSLSASTGS